MFAARQYRFFAGYADKLWGKTIPLDQRDTLDYTTREPIGVAVLITAWNSPMGLLSNKLAPALAAGNCVVVKPSEHASATTLEFAKLIEAAGFPPGVFNVVTGDARVGRALLAGGRIDWVSVTGSPAIRREIAAAAGRALVPVTLELGGKSPNIVFENADLKKAIIGALAGIFAATGQTCIAGSRLDEVPNWQRTVRSDVKPYTADTLEGLAAQMGVPAERLTATVAAFNAATRPGPLRPLECDGLTTAGLTPPKSNWALPIDKGPYRAWLISSANCFTFGGLRCNRQAQVVDHDGRAMANLYAAGETMGLYYGRYTGATSVLRGAVFGRIAGRHAAAGN